MDTIQKHINQQLAAILEQIADPEIPVLSIMDLGVVHSAVFINTNVAKIQIMPTYSGCPAMDVISDDIHKALEKEGIEAHVELVLAPAWSTDMITAKGKSALENYGIAPPLDPTADKDVLLGNKKGLKCPQCGSINTSLVSQFGSTACKALFSCKDCLEPFDYFKCLK
jgi:ring-1,2-phenylacetyl-CoA epoxidase subunit PaaD